MRNRVIVVGNFNVDLLVGPVREIPAWGTENFVSTFLVRTGGAAGNTCLALGRLGVPTLAVGTVGDDLYGRRILDDLISAGVSIEYIEVVRDTPTGVGVTLLRDDGERLFLAFLGHLLQFGDDVLERAAALWEGCRAVLLCGWNDLPALTPHGIRRFLQRARRAGLTTLFDTGWDLDNWNRGGREIVRSLLPYVDIFLPNEAETLAIGAQPDVFEAARALVASGARAVIVKRGALGSVFLDHSRVVEVAAPKVRAVDTVGAGDAFNAGILWGLACGWGFDDMAAIRRLLKFANAVGAHVVQRVTDRYPAPADLAGVAP